MRGWFSRFWAAFDAISHRNTAWEKKIYDIILIRYQAGIIADKSLEQAEFSALRRKEFL
jgi:hypothetical protein